MTEISEVFPWNINFNTGIDGIDQQHRQLVKLINMLASHMVNQSGIHTLNCIYSELTDYAIYHFQTEEAIWSQYFPNDELEIGHKQTHQDFIQTVLDLKGQESNKTQEQIFAAILSFLTHWLAYHILDSDMRLAKAVLGIQSGLFLAEAKLQAKQEMSGGTRILIETILAMYDTLSTRTLQLMKEISDRQKAEVKLRLAANVFDNTLDMICITDAEAHIVDSNPAFCQACDLANKELLGKNLKTLKSGFHDQDFSSAVWETVNNQGHWCGELQNRMPSGEIETDWLTLSSIRDEQGKITNYVGVFSNVSQLLQLQHKLEFNANHDALTGLPNRFLLADRLVQAIANAERNHETGAVCYLDLDGFKSVNDQLGHLAGDYLLCEIAKRLKSVVRNNDTVARVGGDEFVVVLGEMKAPDDYTSILVRLLEAVSQPLPIGNETAHVTTSIGVAIFPHEANDPEALLRLADQAMYLAKDSGKSRYFLAKAIEN